MARAAPAAVYELGVCTNHSQRKKQPQLNADTENATQRTGNSSLPDGEKSDQIFLINLIRTPFHMVQECDRQDERHLGRHLISFRDGKPNATSLNRKREGLTSYQAQMR